MASDAGNTEVDAGYQGPLLLPGCPLDPGPPAIDVDALATSDPTGGPKQFTVDEALAGYPVSEGVLTAVITTEKGTIRCELDETAAPITVANFVGLSRGTRPFKQGGKWKVARFYDGLLWHRVIPGFVIQGGAPVAGGIGGTGYNLVDENHVAEPLGTLAMAATDIPHGSSFFIVIGEGPGPDFNVFGHCETDVAKTIAAEPRNEADRPLEDVHMQRIEIARCAK